MKMKNRLRYNQSVSKTSYYCGRPKRRSKPSTEEEGQQPDTDARIHTVFLVLT